MTQLNTGNIESDRIECKRELGDKFERTVVAFLNSKEGGLIYIGVDDNGEVFGVDDADPVQLAIIDRIKNNILPATLGLFDIIKETYNGKSVLKVVYPVALKSLITSESLECRRKAVLSV